MIEKIISELREALINSGRSELADIISDWDLKEEDDILYDLKKYNVNFIPFLEEDDRKEALIEFEGSLFKAKYIMGTEIGKKYSSLKRKNEYLLILNPTESEDLYYANVTFYYDTEDEAKKANSLIKRKLEGIGFKII